MNKKLLFDFTVNKETNTISVKREFAASSSLVWDAWTKQEIIDQWWASDGWSSESKTMEFKEGGHRHYVMRGPEQAVHWGLTTYKNISLHKSFSGKDCFADEHAVINTDHPQSKYSIEFLDKGEKTLILHTTTYNNLEELEASISYGFEKGTIGAYARLDNILKKKS